MRSGCISAGRSAEHPGFLAALREDGPPDLWRAALVETGAGVLLLPHGRLDMESEIAQATVLGTDPALLEAPMRSLAAAEDTIVIVDMPPGPSAALATVLPLTDLLVTVLLTDASSLAQIPAIDAGQAYGRITAEWFEQDRMGFVLNQWDNRTRLGRASGEAAARHFGARLLGIVYRDENVGEAIAAQRLVAEQAPESKAAQDLARLTETIDQRLASLARLSARVSRRRRRRRSHGARRSERRQRRPRRPPCRGAPRERVLDALIAVAGALLLLAVASVPLTPARAGDLRRDLRRHLPDRQPPQRARRLGVPGRALARGLAALRVLARHLDARFPGFVELVVGSVLVLAELYAVTVLVLGYVQTLWPLERKPMPLPEDVSLWPTVDVYVPTYNEPMSIVRATVLGCVAMDWPRDKLRVWLLDDGRREEFRRFAEELGVGYITRTDNEHAKAGNLNNAMTRTNGEFIAIFDCDHIPTRAFLQMTMGWMLADPRVALVQTPHHFYSPDPFQRNLAAGTRVPPEGNMFYGLVQDGNDYWNATFFCGSCAVLRRAAIEDIGGFAVETVTEDAHTMLKLHRRGWDSAYLRMPLAAGLATERLILHLGQRIRWARGMIQISRIDNPLLRTGPHPRPAHLLRPGDGAFLLRPAARHLPDRAADVPAVQPEHHRRLAARDHRLCAAAHLPLGRDELAPAAELAAFVLERDLRDGARALPRARHHRDAVRAAPRQVQRDGERRAARERLFRSRRGLSEPHPRLPPDRGRDARPRADRLLPERVLTFQALLLNSIWAMLSLLTVMAALAVGRETRQIRSRARIRAELPVVVYLPDGRLVDRHDARPVAGRRQRGGDAARGCRGRRRGGDRVRARNRAAARPGDSPALGRAPDADGLPAAQPGRGGERGGGGVRQGRCLGGLGGLSGGPAARQPLARAGLDPRPVPPARPRPGRAAFRTAHPARFRRTAPPHPAAPPASPRCCWPACCRRCCPAGPRRKSPGNVTVRPVPAPVLPSPRKARPALRWAAR